ncbi:hypothetical protein [Castellaniella sp. MT123]|mgnify:CR=1 FL=1
MSTFTVRLPEDTENHFRSLAATGDPRRALAILDRLDAADRSGKRS